jgi:hypothetical protein
MPPGWLSIRGLQVEPPGFGGKILRENFGRKNGVKDFKFYIGGNSVQNHQIDRKLFSFHFLSSHKSKNVREA